MKKILLALLIGSSFTAQAKDIDAKLVIGTASYHFSSESRRFLNQTNPSIGLELYDVKAVYVSANSWNEESLYLTYSPDYKVNSYLSLSANIGIATGYKCSNNVKKGDYTYNNDYCSNSGIVFLPAITADISPLGNDFALSISANTEVAMFSISYSFN
jgi:hypothetical protein